MGLDSFFIPGQTFVCETVVVQPAEQDIMFFQGITFGQEVLQVGGTGINLI